VCESTTPIRLSSPFLFVGSVAEGGVNGGGATWSQCRTIIVTYWREKVTSTIRETDDGDEEAEYTGDSVSEDPAGEVRGAE